MASQCHYSSKDKETLRFIELVRSYPSIWDCSCPQYIDRSIARECYVSIAKAMGSGMTEEDARRKLKTLRSQFGLNVKKMASWQQGQGDSKARREWKFFRPLHFLLPFTKGRLPPPAVIAPPKAGRAATNDNSSLKSEELSDNHSAGGEDMSPNMSPNSHTGTPQYLSDASVSSSFSGEHENDTEDENSDDSVQNSPRSVQGNLHTSEQNLTRAQCYTQNAEAQPVENASLGSDLGAQRMQCGRRRKGRPNCVESEVLRGVSRKMLKTDKRARAMTANDHFFRMVAMEVSRLPAPVQDSLRYQIHGLLVEEKRKASLSSAAPREEEDVSLTPQHQEDGQLMTKRSVDD